MAFGHSAQRGPRPEPYGPGRLVFHHEHSLQSFQIGGNRRAGEWGIPPGVCHQGRHLGLSRDVAGQGTYEPADCYRPMTYSCDDREIETYHLIQVVGHGESRIIVLESEIAGPPPDTDE